MIKLGVASLQLPATCPQLPVLLIGQIGTLIWRITTTLVFPRYTNRLYAIHLTIIAIHSHDIWGQAV